MLGDSMSDEGEQRMTSIGIEADAAAAQTAGAWLRAARQQRGLHIAALAAMLKVPQAKLEALEADRYQDLPDATFARALAKAMCRVLKVDADPVMGLLPRGGERELDVSRGLNQPYRERGGREDGLSMAWLQRPMVWGPLLLLMAAALVYLMPSSWLVQADSTVPATASSAPALPVAAEPTAVEPAPVFLAPAANVTASEALASPAAVLVPPAASAVSAVPVLTAGQVPLTVRIKTDSWIEVVDARGQTLLSRLLRAGELQELAGQPPLKVTVGNVAGTELTLRGKTVDLSSTKDNVARLELN